MASAPQSNGVTRAYGKAVQIAQPLEAVCEEYDIKEDFDNKHGAPNEPRHPESQSGGILCVILRRSFLPCGHILPDILLYNPILICRDN